MGHGTSFTPSSLTLYNNDPTESGTERIEVSIRHAENSSSSINASDAEEEVVGIVSSGVYWQSGTLALSVTPSATFTAANYVAVTRYKNRVVYGLMVYRVKWKYYYSSGLKINKTKRGTTDLNIWLWDTTDARVSGSGAEDAMFAQTSTVSFKYSSSADDVTALIEAIDDDGITLEAPTGATCTTLSGVSYVKGDAQSVTVTLNIGMNAQTTKPLISRVYVPKLLSSSLFTIFQKANDVTVKIANTSSCYFYVGSSTSMRYSYTKSGTTTIYDTGGTFEVTMCRNGEAIQSVVASYEDDTSLSNLYTSFATNVVETDTKATTHTIASSGSHAFTILLAAYESGEANGWAKIKFVSINKSESVYYGNYDSEVPLSFGRHATQTLIAILPSECGVSKYDVPVSASVSQNPLAWYYGKSTTTVFANRNSHDNGLSVETVDTNYSSRIGYTQLAYNSYFSVKYLGLSSTGGYILSITLSQRRPAFTYPPIPLDTFELPSSTKIPTPGTAVSSWSDYDINDCDIAAIKVKFTTGRSITLQLSHEAPTSAIVSKLTSGLIDSEDFCAIARAALGLRSTDYITVDSFTSTASIRGDTLAESINIGGDNITLKSLNSYTQSLYVSGAQTSSTTTIKILLKNTAKGKVSANDVAQTSSNSSIVSPPPNFPTSSAEWADDYLVISWDSVVAFNVIQSEPGTTLTTSSSDDLLATPTKLF